MRSFPTTELAGKVKDLGVRMMESTKTHGVIVVGLDEQFIHIGICSECFPRVTLTSGEIPLTPPLTFATRLLHTITIHLSIPLENLRRYSLSIAEPVIPLTSVQRGSIEHGGKLLNFERVMFHSATDSLRAATMVSNALIVYVGLKYSAIVTTHRVCIIGVGVEHVEDVLREAITRNNAEINLSPRHIRYIRRMCAVCTDEDVKQAKVRMDGCVLYVGSERARAWDVLFSEDGK